MKIYIPRHTHCSTCGLYSGSNDLGVAFLNREDAEQYLLQHPNENKGWGNDAEVRELTVLEPVADEPVVVNPHACGAGSCTGCELCCYGQA